MHFPLCIKTQIHLVFTHSRENRVFCSIMFEGTVAHHDQKCLFTFFTCRELRICSKKMQYGECPFSKALKLFYTYEEENMSWFGFFCCWQLFLAILKLWQFLTLFYEVFYADWLWTYAQAESQDGSHLWVCLRIKPSLPCSLPIPRCAFQDAVRSQIIVWSVQCVTW